MWPYILKNMFPKIRKLFILSKFKNHHTFERNNNIHTHGQRTSRESFFSKIQKFWAWADKLGWNFGVHFGYFQPNYWHYFGTVSPLFMGKCSWIFFLQKCWFLSLKHVTPKCSQNKIWAKKIWGTAFTLPSSVLG